MPSGVTKPSATCRSGEAARIAGYATVGNLMAPFASAWTGSATSAGTAGGADVTGGSAGMVPGHAGIEPGHPGAGEPGAAGAAEPGPAGAGDVGTGRRCDGNKGSEGCCGAFTCQGSGATAASVVAPVENRPPYRPVSTPYVPLSSCGARSVMICPSIGRSGSTTTLLGSIT